jgi:hypothetical protein
VTDEPPQTPDDEANGYALPEIHPDLRAMFDKTDALFAGMSRAEALDATKRLFIDADGEPRIRHKLHLVRNDPVPESTADADSDGPQVEGLAAADPSNDEPAYIRDVDLLTPEDRERGERMMDRVLADVERRRADRANGVIELSRERYMRLRRRKGLPTPD